VSGTIGVGYLSLSALLSRLKAFQLPWSAGLYSIGLLLWRRIKKQRLLLDSEDISSALQYSSERVSLVAILLPLRISQEQGEETKDNGEFETVHQGRSGSNFSQHAATCDAELPETLRGMC
jgi:hypothetical protein